MHNCQQYIKRKIVQITVAGYVDAIKGNVVDLSLYIDLNYAGKWSIYCIE